MSQLCENIREEIGQSVAGELSIKVHQHIKDCKECDNYAQKIIRLEMVFKEEGLITELAGKSSTRKLKWMLMSVAACIILLLPDRDKYDLESQVYEELLPNKNIAFEQVDTSAGTQEENLSQYVRNWSEVEQALWEQIGEMDWIDDEYTESMEVINQWQIDQIGMHES